MKDLMFSELLEIYGKMLTNKQFSMAEQYYNLDYSLAEIAENEGITRQAVHASIKQAQDVLSELEEKLGFCSMIQKIRVELESVKESANAEILRNALTAINEII